MSLLQIRDGVAGFGPPDEPTARLQLKIKAPKTGYVDGAWWPRGDALATELPALLAALPARLGPISQVAYRIDEWATGPSELIVAGRTVRLTGHQYGTAHTVEVLSANNRRLILLVVPPYTDAHDAFAAMTSASAVNDVSTVDELLMIDEGDRSDRTERAAAVHRWDTDGGSTRTAARALTFDLERY